MAVADRAPCRRPFVAVEGLEIAERFLDLAAASPDTG